MSKFLYSGIDRRKIFFGLFLIIGFFFFFVFLSACTQEHAYSLVLICSLIYIFLIFKFILDIPFMSFENFFILLVFLFHYGQIIKIGFNLGGTIPFDYRLYGSLNSQKASILFVLLSIFSLSLGISICRKSTRQVSVGKFEISSKVLRLGWLFFFIGILPRLYIDITKIQTALIGNYESVYTLYFPQFLQTIAFFANVGVLLILLYSKKKRFLFWAVLFYELMSMFSGNRQYQLAFLITWIYCYYFILNKVKTKKMIGFFFAVFLGVVFVSIIGEIRTVDISLDSFGNAFGVNVLDMFGSSLGEFGSALTTLIVPVEQIKNIGEFGFGKSYFAGVTTVVPLLTNFLNLSEEIIFIKHFRGVTYLGGSYIAESFYNFSWGGFVISIVFGVILEKTLSKIRNSNNKSIADILFSYITLYALILSVRGYFADSIQILIWCYTFSCLLTHKSKILIPKQSEVKTWNV